MGLAQLPKPKVGKVFPDAICKEDVKYKLTTKDYFQMAGIAIGVGVAAYIALVLWF